MRLGISLLCPYALLVCLLMLGLVFHVCRNKSDTTRFMLLAPSDLVLVSLLNVANEQLSKKRKLSRHRHSTNSYGCSVQTHTDSIGRR